MSLSRISPAGPRTHVLEIAGNGIIGGMEISLLRLAQWLPRERFALTVLCPFEGPLTQRLRRLGIEVFIAPMPAEEASWAAVQVARSLVQSRDVHVLHAHLGNAHLLAGLTGALTRRPVLATVHGRNVTLLDLEVQRAAGTHLHLVSRQAHLHALGLGVAATSLHHIGNGVDVEEFAPRTMSAHPLRERLGIARNAPLVGFVGRLSWEKAPDVLLRAAALLSARHPDARFVFVGDGPMEKELRLLATQLGLTDRVFFAGLQQDVASIYAQLDVLTCPSHQEAMPLVVLEAMASGIAVVATQVGSVADLVQHSLTGWLVPPDDPRQLADRLATLLADPPLREQMGAAARLAAVERFSLADRLEAQGRLLTQLARAPTEAERTVDGTAAVERERATP